MNQNAPSRMKNSFYFCAGAYVTPLHPSLSRQTFWIRLCVPKNSSQIYATGSLRQNSLKVTKFKNNSRNNNHELYDI